jgi:hypothetical protein
MFLSRMTEILRVLMGHTLHNGCIVDRFQYRQASSKSTERESERYQIQRALLHAGKGIGKLLLTCMVPTLFRGDVSE